jgi:hypothetical protein
VKIRGDVAEPQVELWIESGKNVSPEEAARAAADARTALEQALASRNLGEGGQLLVVRAQGVSRTRSRRADQSAAVAGIVVGAVAVVAIVVVLVATQGKGGGGGRAPAAHPAPAPGVRPAPAPGTVAVRPAPVPPARAAPPPVAPAVRPSGGPGHGEVGIGFGADVQIVVPTPPNGPLPAAVWSDSVVTAPPPPPPREPTLTEVVLPPPPPLEVGRRGFFDEDLTRLELTLVDRATGAPLWVKTVEREIDPRDAGAVRALLDGALDGPGG